MKHYETAFLIAPNLPEEEIEQLILQMAEVVSDRKGKMNNLDRWGKRKMAYSIGGFEEAYYVFFHYEGDPEIPAELERRFKQIEAIIRFLTVKAELKKKARKRRRERTTPSRRPRVPREEEREASEGRLKEKEEVLASEEDTDAEEK